MADWMPESSCSHCTTVHTQGSIATVSCRNNNKKTNQASEIWVLLGLGQIISEIIFRLTHHGQPSSHPTNQHGLSPLTETITASHSIWHQADPLNTNHGRWSQLGYWSSQLGYWSSHLGYWSSHLGFWSSQLGNWLWKLRNWSSQLEYWSSQLEEWS